METLITTKRECGQCLKGQGRKAGEGGVRTRQWKAMLSNFDKDSGRTPAFYAQHADWSPAQGISLEKVSGNPNHGGSEGGCFSKAPDQKARKVEEDLKRWEKNRHDVSGQWGNLQDSDWVPGCKKTELK